MKKKALISGFLTWLGAAIFYFIMSSTVQADTSVSYQPLLLIVTIIGVGFLLLVGALYMIIAVLASWR